MAAWNLFDVSLVVVMMFDMILIPLFSETGSSHMGSMLRIFRMARILRIIRLFRLFSMLAVIVQAFVKAMAVVVWVGLLMFIIDYVFAIVATTIVGHHADAWAEHAPEIKQWFGTIPASMQSLFIIMTLAEWDTMAKILSAHMPPGLVWAFFIIYILVVSYSMTSLITGVMSESLIAARSSEEKLRLQELEENRKALFTSLRQILADIDRDNSGEITRDEITSALMEHPELLPKLAACDVELNEADLIELFDKLRQGNESLSIAKFVDALSSLTGSAKAAALFDLKTDLERQVGDLHNVVMEQSGEILLLKKSVAEVHGKLDEIITELRRR